MTLILEDLFKTKLLNSFQKIYVPNKVINLKSFFSRCLDLNKGLSQISPLVSVY